MLSAKVRDTGGRISRANRSASGTRGSLSATRGSIGDPVKAVRLLDTWKRYPRVGGMPLRPAPVGFRGTLRDDPLALAVYSEAAGIARIMPRAVAVPADPADVAMLVRWAADTATPLIPRGSGSSMSGGAIGDGVVVDLSRLDEIHAPDVVRRTIRCGPGAVRDAVDAA